MLTEPTMSLAIPVAEGIFVYFPELHLDSLTRSDEFASRYRAFHC